MWICFLLTYGGLQEDIFLHPLDGFTAYTLQRGEFVYSQSLFTLPLPSWAWWGITDYLTAEIDLLPLIGGLFQEPHLPVPSFNFRFRLSQSENSSVALEVMYQHLWRNVNQSEKPLVSRRGNSLYMHTNFSWRRTRKFHIHLSAGFTYQDYLYMSTADSLNPVAAQFHNFLTPDISLSLDYRWKPFISLHATFSHGSTFKYLDNVPRKWQVSYGFRLAPFYRSRMGILRNMRMEFAAFYIHLPDIGESIIFPIPLISYFYWQWIF